MVTAERGALLTDTTSFLGLGRDGVVDVSGRGKRRACTLEECCAGRRICRCCTAGDQHIGLDADLSGYRGRGGTVCALGGGCDRDTSSEAASLPCHYPLGAGFRYDRPGIVCCESQRAPPRNCACTFGEYLGGLADRLGFRAWVVQAKLVAPGGRSGTYTTCLGRLGVPYPPYRSSRFGEMGRPGVLPKGCH